MQLLLSIALVDTNAISPKRTSIVKVAYCLQKICQNCLQFQLSDLGIQARSEVQCVGPPCIRNSYEGEVTIDILMLEATVECS